MNHLRKIKKEELRGSVDDKDSECESDVNEESKSEIENIDSEN